MNTSVGEIIDDLSELDRFLQNAVGLDDETANKWRNSVSAAQAIVIVTPQAKLDSLITDPGF